MDMASPSWLQVALVSLLWICCRTQECDYRFSRQPPTTLSCNPYDSVNRLALTCSVEGPNSPTFSIIWFRRRNSIDEELQESSSVNILGSETVGGTVQFIRRSSLLTLSELDEVDEYWCQVRLENGTLFQEMSNILTLSAEDQYIGLPRCGVSDGQVDQVDCLLMRPGGAGGNLSTTAGSEVLPMSSVNPPLTPTTGGPVEEPESGSKNLAALYAVVAVIVVFCIVIVTLTVIIVVLYRKKCGPIKFKTEDHHPTTNPYSGFTRERLSSSHSNIVTKGERSDSRLTNSSQSHHRQQDFSSPAPFISGSEEEPYSRLIRDPPPQQPGGVVEVLPGYSKLKIQDSVPPLPPKPPSTKSRSRTPPSHTPIHPTTSSPAERQSEIYNDLTDKDLERGIKSNRTVPPVDIYNTLESNMEVTLGLDGHEYQQLHPERERQDYGEDFTEWGMNQATKTSTEKTLFDDPEYSPLKGICKRTVAVVDPRYIGDYERSPTYTCPTVQMKASDIDPKYRGDYEWDPTYVPKPSPRRASFSSVGVHRIPKPNEVLQRRKSLEADALHRYIGDYEWSPNYVPAPLRNGSSGPLPALDRKYSGNYERDPVYVAHVLKKSAQERQRSHSVEYTIPGAQSRENSVPPHIPHEYALLEDNLKDPPQQYARLNSQTPELP